MFKQIFRAFVYSNLWVGFSVASLSALSMLRFDIWNTPYLFVCLFSTIAFYGYARWVETTDLEATPEQHIAAWTIHHRTLILTLSTVSTAAAVFFWFQLPSIPRWTYAICGALSGLYTIPSLFNSKGIRYLAGVKLVYIALIWTAVTVTIPALIANEAIDKNLILFHIERFAFVIALTIPFDIRDTKTDSTDLLTLPMWLGIMGARNVALSAMAFVILLQFYPGYNLPNVPYGEIAVFLFGGYLVHRSHEDLPDMFFSFAIEGLPILLAAQALTASFVASSF